MPRSTYRHGDLRRALLEAGMALARGGGPDAVVLREATRRAGVAPNAAYRHFANRQALLQAVRAAALSRRGGPWRCTWSSCSGLFNSSGRRARASVRAVGTGYLRFARRETGLFRTAFASPVEAPSSTPDAPDVDKTPDADKAGQSGLNPFQLLGAALDRLVDAGVLPPERRPGAEFLAWSAVHGLAMLVIDGPLAGAVGPQMEQVGQRLLDMVEKGL